MAEHLGTGLAVDFQRLSGRRRRNFPGNSAARMIVTVFVTEESVGRPWTFLGVLVPVGGVAMALLLVRVAQEGGSNGWLGVVFAGLGFGVIATVRYEYPWALLLAAALLGVAAWYAGRGLWSPEYPVDVADRLLGGDLPGIDRYAAWLLLVVSALGTIAVSVLLWRRRDLGAVRKPMVVLVAGAVLAAAGLGGVLWAGGTAAAVLADSEDHTTAPEAPDPRPEPPRGPERDLAPVWNQGGDVRYGDQAALVPGTDLAVMFGFEAGVGTDYGLFVLDATTGEERWHYRIRPIPNTSPGGFMGVVAGVRTGTLLAVVSNVGILFDLDTGQVRSRFAFPHVPGDDSRYRVLSDSPLLNDRSVIQLSSGSVGYLAAHGDGVTTLLSVDLNTGEVHSADRAPSGECRYQHSGQSTEDGAFLVRSGRGCGQPVVLSMTRERVEATFDLPAVEQEATTCTEPECDGPGVSAAAGRLVVNVGRELHAFDRNRPLWTSPVAAGAQVTAVGPSDGEPPRVVAETAAGTTVINGDTGTVLGPLAPLPGTGNGSEVTPDTGWYRIHRLDEETIELVLVDLGSLTVVTRSEPVLCGEGPATDPPPLSAASGRLLVTCWPATKFTMTVLGN